MDITHYSFGKIIIDGKVYTSDIIVYPERINSSWWRKEGHYLDIDDLKGVIETRPDILIIGTGYSGGMKVPEETKKYIESMGIEVHILITEEAVKLLNKPQKDRVVIAALHLTC
jgi:hypothetical protein